MPKKWTCNLTGFLGHLFFFQLLIISPHCYAKELSKSVNSFGVPGIIDMPTAGSFSDGELGFTYSKHGPNLRNTITFQALPRVTGAFRYSGVGDRNLLFINSGYSNWDRSFDLRVDLLKQNKYLPDLTVGLQDFIGTGMYSGEYLVASKSFLNKVRFTAGLGWGRLSTRSENIITNTGPRNNTTSSLGGTLNYNRFFRGDVATFGGIEYQTPLKKLKIKAELSSDDYSRDRYLSMYTVQNQYNYGAEYKLNEAIDVSAYYLNEKEMGLRIKISADPKKSNPGNFMEPVPQPFYSFPFSKEELEKDYIEEIRESLKQEKISLVASKQDVKNQIIIIEHSHYSTHTQAIGRTLRIMSRYVPLGYNEFTVVISEIGVPIVEITLDRNELASIIDAPNAELITHKISKIKSAKKIYYNSNDKIRSNLNFDWSIYPYHRLHLFDPNKPLYYDLGPRIKTSFAPKPGLIFLASIEKSLISSFDEINRGPKGGLPKVRTNLRNYLNVLDERIEYLTAGSYFKLSDQIYGRITAGYLEPMFAGISSELLYAPINQNYAIGAEINAVKGREFRQLFGFREISGMPRLNGHISGYFDTGFYHYNSQIDFGKYLAGDNGATLTLSRNFPNGWRVGGFFSLTDASFSEFGEGSFDKGIFMRIPFNSILPYETTGGIHETIKPIQGDGGARVIVPYRLYDMVHDKSKNSLDNNWAKIWR